MWIQLFIGFHFLNKFESNSLKNRFIRYKIVAGYNADILSIFIK